MTAEATLAPNPRRYFETVKAERSVEADSAPVCAYLEVTNRCNLLCETCPRTFETLEPPADMSWELFTRIVDQLPGLTRAVLHGVGEPRRRPERSGKDRLHRGRLFRWAARLHAEVRRESAAAYESVRGHHLRSGG